MPFELDKIIEKAYKRQNLEEEEFVELCDAV